MPDPRGKKSRPTMFSNTELLPLDWEPTTTICGKSIGFWTCEAMSGRAEGDTNGYAAYANRGKHILKFVDKRDQLRIIDIDTGTVSK